MLVTNLNLFQGLYVTLSVGIKHKGQSLLFTDCMATEVDINGKQLGFSEANKLAKIFEGIHFSMIGDAHACKMIRDLCRDLPSSSSTIEEAFATIKTFLLSADFGEYNCEFLLISRHKKNESSLFHYSSLKKELNEVLDGHHIVLGSGKMAVEEKLNHAIPTGIATFRFEDQFPRLISSYLNQWCFGSNVHEGYLSNFGYRVVYLLQNVQKEVYQPTSVTFLVNHTLSKIKIRIFSHFWDDYGLVIYDSYKHRLNYLVDDNPYNIETIPKSEALFERMRQIYFNYQHEYWDFIFLPDIQTYDFLKSAPFSFIEGEPAFPEVIKERLNKIAQYFQKDAEVTFGE
jgi:hypothetical protein